MQIDAIHINKLLSFDTFVWKELDPHLNVIVGPNGVGKTNLFHALRIVRDILIPARSQNTERWASAGHQGSDADTITIQLDIQFTTEWEKRLLCVFFAATLCDQQEIQQIATTMQRAVDPVGLKLFDSWALEHIRPEDISWFLHGRLVITRAGRSGWQCWYESCPGKPAFRLDLSNWEMLVGHATHNTQTTTQNWGMLFVAWRNNLTTQERTQLDNELTGTPSGMGFPIPDLSQLPNWVSSQQGIALQVRDQMQIVDPTTLATRRILTSVTGISSLGQNFGMRSVFRLLLERALVFTDNVRLVPQSLFAADHLFTQPFDLSNGEQLARYLFCKKNGNASDRKQYDDIGNLFTRMTARSFNVVSNPAKPEGSQPRLLVSQQQERLPLDQQPDVSLELVTTSSWGDIPLEFSGAGIAEALFLSAVLAGSTGQVVLLDEPALNLHPTMQTTLLNELQTLAHLPGGEGNQFLMSTHSPTLIPPDAIENVSRFTLQDGHAIRQALKVSQNDLIKLRQLLRGNLAVRAFLFSRAVLLVEGETELGALPIWCPDLARQDIALYSVGGKGAFVSPLRLIRSFAIPWAIIGDGEVLWDLSEKKSRQGPQGQIERILTVCGQSLPTIPGDPGGNEKDFTQWQHILETYGIFTLANGASEGIEKAIQAEISSELWTRATGEFGANKVARGRFIAENCPCPTKVAALIHKVLRHLQKQDASISVPGGGCP